MYLSTQCQTRKSEISWSDGHLRSTSVRAKQVPPAPSTALSNEQKNKKVPACSHFLFFTHLALLITYAHYSMCKTSTCSNSPFVNHAGMLTHLRSLYHEAMLHDRDLHELRSAVLLYHMRTEKPQKV